MFKAIATYLVVKKVVSFIVCAAMMIGLMAVCLVAYVLAPEASADEMNPYAGKYYTLDNEEDGTAFYVNNDGTVTVRYNDNLRVGYYFDYNIGSNCIGVKTLDLNKPFALIAQQLDRLASEL